MYIESADTGVVLLGQGVDISQGLERAIAPTNIIPKEEIDGQKTFKSFTIVTSLEQVANSKSISLRGKIKNGMFSASSSLRATSRSKINSFDVYCFGGSNILDGVEFCDRWTMNPEFEDYLDDPGEFLLKFGNRFVSSRSKGAELNAIIRFSTSSAQHRDEIRGKLSASGILGGSFTGSVKGTLETLAQTSTLTAEVIQKGGQAVEIREWEKFAETIDKFEQLVTQGNSVVLGYTLGEYLLLEEIGGAFSLGLDKLIKKQERELDKLARRYSELELISSDIDFALQHRPRFNLTDQKEKDLKKVLDDIANIQRAIIYAADDLSFDATTVIDYQEFILAPFEDLIDSAPATVIPPLVVVPVVDPVVVPVVDPVVVELYGGDHFTGTILKVTRDSPNLPHGFNDWAKSVKVTGPFAHKYKVTFYRSELYKNQKFTIVGPGAKPTLGSIEIQSGIGEDAALFYDFNKVISSIKVELV